LANISKENTFVVLVTYIGADPTNVNDDNESYPGLYPASVNDNFNVTSTTNVFCFEMLAKVM